MAEVEKKNAVVETQVVEIEPEHFVMKLTSDEASALLAVLGSGSVFERRTDGMYKQLLEAGAESKYRIVAANKRSDPYIPAYKLVERNSPA